MKAVLTASEFRVGTSLSHPCNLACSSSCRLMSLALPVRGKADGYSRAGRPTNDRRYGAETV